MPDPGLSTTAPPRVTVASAPVSCAFADQTRLEIVAVPDNVSVSRSPALPPPLTARVVPSPKVVCESASVAPALTLTVPSLVSVEPENSSVPPVTLSSPWFTNPHATTPV